MKCFRIVTWALCSVVLLAELSADQAVFTQPTPAVLNALQTGGLPSAVTLVGHYVGVADPIERRAIASDLFVLSTHSDVVVLGRIESKAPSQLSSNMREISTDYVLSVAERFQGAVAVGASVTLRLPGGLVQFSNGTSAELRSTRLPNGLALGQEYVMFLSHIDGGTNTFGLVLGLQGLFGLGTDGRVVSAGRDIDEVYKKYNGLGRDAFLGRVRSSTIPWRFWIENLCMSGVVRLAVYPAIMPKWDEPSPAGVTVDAPMVMKPPTWWGAIWAKPL
jgi:hypothetical protein